MKITLEWEYLKYDIDSETWKSAKSRITEPAMAEIKSEAQTGGDPLDMDYCVRKIEQGMSKIAELSHKFIIPDKTNATNVLTDIEGNPRFEILIEVSERNSLNSHLLASTIHNYVVLNVLHEWAKMMLPSMEQTYANRMTDERNNIMRIIYRKEPPKLEL